MKMAGVSQAALAKHGAVSHQVAEEMARGGRAALGVDVCLADTGIAGPGGATPGKPSGLFYLGLSHEGGTESQKHIFPGNREWIEPGINGWLRLGTGRKSAGLPRARV